MGRVTALGLEREGVVFRMTGRGPIVSGPSARSELLDALRAEVARRAAAMRPMVGREMRVVLTPNPPTARTGWCDCCGDAMRPYLGGMCAICILALSRAAKVGAP